MNRANIRKNSPEHYETFLTLLQAGFAVLCIESVLLDQQYGIGKIDQPMVESTYE